MSEYLNDVEAIRQLLVHSLLFYPLVRAIILATGKIETEPIEAIKHLLIGAMLNILLIAAVVVIVKLIELL
jgi:hypothetical protein